MRILRFPALPKLVAATFMTIALAGCASQAPTQTGFLGDYSQLQPTRDHPDDLGWRNSGVYLTYWGFILDKVVYRPTKGAPQLDEKTKAELTDAYRKSLVDAFSKCFRPAESPGPGVLRIRAAVTNVAKAQPVLNFITMAAILVPATAGGGSTEAEVVDSTTGERLAAYIGYNNGGQSFLGGPIGFLSQYGQARRAFTIQAEELRGLLMQDGTQSTQNGSASSRKSMPDEMAGHCR